MKQVVFLLSLFAILGCASSQKNLTLIAHRGASGYLPEHTLASAALAHSWDVDFIEADLVMTKDNKLIVLHDIHIDTTTNVAQVFPKRKRADGRYYAIDFTLEEIRKLQAFERFDPKTGRRIFENRYPEGPSGLLIPTFDDFVKLVKALNKGRHKNIGIYPEIKEPAFHTKEGKDITKAVLESIRSYGYEQTPQQIYIQCFDPKALIRIKNEFNTKIPLIQLVAENSWKESDADYEKMLTDEGLQKVASYAQGIGPYLNQIDRDPTLPKRAHKLNLLIHPYTHRADDRPQGLSEKEYVQKIRKLEVDGIFSDFADQFKKN